MDVDRELSSDYDSDEDLGLLKKALDVQLSADFDPQKVPQDGNEYLQHVMYEAKRCKQLVVVPVDESKVKPITEIAIKESCLKAPTSFMPSKQWQEDALNDFTLFRKYICHKQQTPLKKDFNIKDLLNNHPPTLPVVTSFSEEEKLKALDAITNAIAETPPGKGIKEQQGLWVYSLLSTLDTPLFPDSCHCLRELARICSQVRSKLTQSAPQSDYVPLNLIICIIARFFRQLDLADE